MRPGIRTGAEEHDRLSLRNGVNVTNGTILWAGKELSSEEEAGLRRVVHILRRNGAVADAECLERFLPDNLDTWTPNELETGAHVGPWMSFGAQVHVEEGGFCGPDREQPQGGSGPLNSGDRRGLAH
jgi:hypothetical protein